MPAVVQSDILWSGPVGLGTLWCIQANFFFFFSILQILTSDSNIHRPTISYSIGPDFLRRSSSWGECISDYDPGDYGFYLGEVFLRNRRAYLTCWLGSSSTTRFSTFANSSVASARWVTKSSGKLCKFTHFNRKTFTEETSANSGGVVINSSALTRSRRHVRERSVEMSELYWLGSPWDHAL